MNALRRIGWFLGTRLRWRRARLTAAPRAERGAVPYTNAVIYDETHVWDAEKMEAIVAWMKAHEVEFPRQYLNQWSSADTGTEQVR